MGRRSVAVAGFLALLLGGCQNANDIALKIGKPPSDVAKLRVIETQRIDDPSQMALLKSATAVLQDLGFTITDSSAATGVLVAAKHRDAEETGQVVGQIALLSWRTNRYHVFYQAAYRTSGA